MDADLVPGPDDVEAFRADGHLLVPGLVPRQELRAARSAARRLARQAVARATAEGPAVPPQETSESPDGQGRVARFPDPYLPVVELWKHDETLRRLVLSPRLGRVAATLLGVPSVRLYHDELFVKPPGSIVTFWHQDQVYWPVDTSSVVAPGEIGMARIWITLTELPFDRGGLRFVSGSHRDGPITDRETPHPNAGGTATVDGRQLPVTMYGHLGAGDATVHAGYTLHAGGSNRTDVTRFGLAVAYVPDGARVAEPSTDVHELNIAMWMSGRRPGELVDGESNPVVWPPTAPTAR